MMNLRDRSSAGATSTASALAALGAPETYRTTGVEPQRRTTYWNEVYRKFAQVTFAPDDRAGFEAMLRLGRVGLVDFAWIRTQATAVERTIEHARSANDRLLAFILLVRGKGVFSHCGRESCLEEGDIVICDNTEPSTSRYDGPAELVIARAPESVVRPRLPRLDDLCGQRLPAGSGVGAVAFSIARTLGERIEEPLRPDHALPVSLQLLDVLSMAYMEEDRGGIAEETVHGARATHARHYIESRLNDPELTPREVAEAQQISCRYLRLLMTGEGETVTGYILRRRLEECAKQLANPRAAHRTITDIAFDWGFNSMAHFTRVFKAKYDMTPREYRARSWSL